MTLRFNPFGLIDRALGGYLTQHEAADEARGVWAAREDVKTVVAFKARPITPDPIADDWRQIKVAICDAAQRVMQGYRTTRQWLTTFTP